MAAFTHAPLHEALFLPAHQSAYTAPLAKAASRPLPSGLVLADLNILDPSAALMFAPAGLYSYAVKASPPCAVTVRDRTSTMILGDSGGFSLATTGKVPGPVSAVLAWLEATADWAMTYDAPIAVTQRIPKTPGFATFAECKRWSEGNLRHFELHRTPGRTRFLNVIQCPNRRQAKRWLKMATKFAFCDGIAFAGPLKADFSLILDLLLRMRADGTLAAVRWIHFLGTADLEIACILSALQDALQQELGVEITVSFDASSASLSAGRFGDIYVGHALGKRSFNMLSVDAPDDPSYVGSSIPLPWKSVVGQHLTLGWLNVRTRTVQQTCYDDLSQAAMINHNTELLTRGIAAAQALARLRSASYLPARLLTALRVVDQMFSQPNPQAFVRSHAAYLDFGDPPIPDDGT